VLFPSVPRSTVLKEELLSEIQSFIHRYVDVSPLFEKTASYYTLLSWVYDGFNELPYLRLRGDPGSGKTRFLLTWLPVLPADLRECASTVSPIFRMLDSFRRPPHHRRGGLRFSD